MADESEEVVDEGGSEENDKQKKRGRRKFGTTWMRTSFRARKKSGTAAEEQARKLKAKSSFGDVMMKRVRSLQKKTSFHRDVEITEELLNKLKDTLPPEEPESLDGTGKRDISLFATTWNMDYCDPPSEETVKYWLPKGYDMYLISLQCCTAFLELSKTCVNYLNEEEDTYDEFMDFMHVQGDSISQQNSLILLFLVHSSLLEEDVFKRSNLKRQKPSRALTSPAASSGGSSARSIVRGTRREPERKSGGVLIMQFEVFDTVVLVVNAQLTRAMSRTSERVADMRSIVNYINQLEADHVILMGDMGTEGLIEFDDDDVMKTLREGQKEGRGWGDDRFKPIVDNDEVTLVLHQQVKSFSEFEELPINFPPTSARKPRENLRVDQLYLAQMFHKGFNIVNLYDQAKGKLPSYNERIFFKTLLQQHKPGFRAYASGSCEGVTVSTNVPVFTTFRVWNKEFSTPEDEFVHTLVDEDDLEVITDELRKYAPEETRKNVERARLEKKQKQKAREAPLEKTESQGNRLLLVNDDQEESQLVEQTQGKPQHEDEEEEEEVEVGLLYPKPADPKRASALRPNRLFRPDPKMHRESYVTVFDLLSLPPPPSGQRYSRRFSVNSSVSYGPPPPPLDSELGNTYAPPLDDEKDSLFSDDSDDSLDGI